MKGLDIRYFLTVYKRHKLVYIIHINRIREMVSFELGKEIEK